MNAVTFDTLKFVETLEKADVPREQAKAEAEALRTAMESNNSGTIDKKDVQAMEDRMNAKFTLLQWMVGFSMVMNTAILIKLLAGN